MHGRSVIGVIIPLFVIVIIGKSVCAIDPQRKEEATYGSVPGDYISNISKVRKRRNPILLGLALINLGTSIANVIVDLTRCKTLIPNIKVIEKDITFHAKSIERLIQTYKNQRKQSEKSFDTVQNIQRRFTYIDEIFRSTNNDVQHILNHFRNVNAKLKALNETDVDESIKGNIMTDVKDVYDRLYNFHSIIGGTDHAYKIASTTAILPPLVKMRGIISKMKWTKVKIFKKVGGRTRRRQFYKTTLKLMAGVGLAGSAIFDIVTILKKTKNCNKLKMELRKHMESLISYKNGVNNEIQYLVRATKNHENGYRKYVKTMQVIPFVDFLPSLENDLFGKAVYVPSFVEGSQYYKIKALSDKLTLDINDWSSNEKIIDAWIDILNAYRRDVYCLKAQVDAIDGMADMCINGDRRSLRELFGVMKPAKEECGELSRWEMTKVISLVDAQLKINRSSNDCPQNHPLKKKMVCMHWFMGLSNSEISLKENITKSQVESMLLACPKETLTDATKKEICQEKSYGMPFERILQKRSRRFRTTDVKSLYNKC